MSRLTNRKIIDKLLPILKEKEKQPIPDLNKLDFYKHPYHEEWIENNISVRWVSYEEGYIYIKATMRLTGKYDHAELAKLFIDGKPELNYGYSKEYTGLGNGFYADVSPTGKIIKSEWD